MLIAEYFQTIETLILECAHLVESTLSKDQRSLHIGIIEGNLTFSNDSVLHFIEFVNVKGSTELYKYSYHYQDHQGNLIFRYDMAPHHRSVPTFPHHKHINENIVIESFCPTLEQVLNEIEEIILD